MVQDKRWSYGAIANGSTERFIRTADQEVYNTMADYWDTPQGASKMVNSQAEGLEMVSTEHTEINKYHLNVFNWIMTKHLIDD